MSCRDWCFTDFDTREDNFDFDKIKYLIYGTEKCPTTDRIHKQGFVIFTSTCRRPGCQKRLGRGSECHVEPRRGTRTDARDYCGKDGVTFEYGQFDAMTQTELFEQPEQYLIKNYPDFYQRYFRVIARRQDKGPMWRGALDVVWLWGKPGCGKTRCVMEQADVYRLDYPYKWWDGYEGEDTLLIDDYTDWNIENSILRNILDGYRLRLETKGGHTWARWGRVFITSNKNPILMQQWDAPLQRRVSAIRECNGCDGVTG